MAIPRFINIFKKMAPRWLTEGDGGLVLTTLGVLEDALVERTRQGVEARFPELAPSDALAPLGRDRRLLRGINDTDATYATRLLRWLDDWKIAGNPYALMMQLRAYTGFNMKIRTVDNRGNWYSIDPDGTRSFLLNQGNWDWDGDAAKWSRFWVIMYPPSLLWEPSPPIGDPELWGGAIGTAGYTIGSTATPEQVRSVKSIVRDWKPAGTICVRIILAWTASDFDPADASPPNPDGDWNLASNRNSNAVYWPGN